MEVKSVEIQIIKPAQNSTADNTSASKRAGVNARSISSLSALSVQSDAVSVEVPKQSANIVRSQTRINVNRAITASNIAKQGTEQINDIVGSISGIVELAEKASITPERKSVLQREANNLLEEIRKVANTASPDGIKPLAGDKIRLEVEEDLGKALDRILPDSAKDSFGIGQIDFSTKETIINTRTKIKRAEEQINKLRAAVDDTSSEVRRAADRIDVAIQNSDASQASVRDVDQAIKLADETRDQIRNNPERALLSIGDLASRTTNPLEEN